MPAEWGDWRVPVIAAVIYFVGSGIGYLLLRLATGGRKKNPDENA